MPFHFDRVLLLPLEQFISFDNLTISWITTLQQGGRELSRHWLLWWIQIALDILRFGTCCSVNTIYSHADIGAGIVKQTQALETFCCGVVFLTPICTAFCGGALAYSTPVGILAFCGGALLYNTIAINWAQLLWTTFLHGYSSWTPSQFVAFCGGALAVLLVAITDTQYRQTFCCGVNRFTPILSLAFCGGALACSLAQFLSGYSIHLTQFFCFGIALTPLFHLAFCGGAYILTFSNTFTQYIWTFCCGVKQVENCKLNNCGRASLPICCGLHSTHTSVQALLILITPNWLTFCGGVQVQALLYATQTLWTFCCGVNFWLSNISNFTGFWYLFWLAFGTTQNNWAFCCGAVTLNGYIGQRLARLLTVLCVWKAYCDGPLTLNSCPPCCRLIFSAISGGRPLRLGLQFLSLCNFLPEWQIGRNNILRQQVTRAEDRGIQTSKLGSKPGPKSRRGLKISATAFSLGCSFSIALSWIFYMDTFSGHRSEGCGLAMETTEAPPHWCSVLHNIQGAKPHGLQPQMCGGTPFRLGTASKVVKRSILRAHKRAIINGVAWYRGKAYTAEDFLRMGCPPVSWPPSMTISDSQGHVTPAIPPQCISNWTSQNAGQAPSRRLKCWLWNCGGLAVQKLDEVLIWLDLHAIDLAVMVESRWTFDGEWQDATWNFVHSGAGAHRGKGILVLVRKSLCAGHQITWQHYAPGRLLHVRLNFSSRPIDVLACYQHTFAGPQSLPDRDKWWTLLENTLQGLPKRNNLVMLGDFNCSLGHTGSNVGTTLFRWRGQLTAGKQHPDQGRFQSLLRFFGLVVLNSWSSGLGPTYVHDAKASRIDYLIVRKPHADGQAASLALNKWGHRKALLRITQLTCRNGAWSSVYST